MSAGHVILPGHSVLGVLGGGQLGRMFVHAAQAMGYFTAVLDPDADSPAGLVSHHHIQADYGDVAALKRMAALCDAITTEFENVPATSLAALSAICPVAPASTAVAIAQDRLREKAHFQTCGVPCAPYAAIASDDDVAVAEAALFPGILKTAQLGYDGKGQARVANRQELAAAWQMLKRVPCILEKELSLAMECSVVIARGGDGQVVHFAPQSNLHRGGILAVTEAHEDSLPPALAELAAQSACAVAHGLDYTGVLCIEFFVLADGSLVVNEMAPRPHNSGHYTLDACDVSQFDLQVRTMTGLPLCAPRQHSAAVMLNLLGDLWQRDGEKMVSPQWERILAIPGAHLHLYGKRQARPGRKMGHLTLTGDSATQVRARAAQAADILGMETPW